MPPLETTPGASGKGHTDPREGLGIAKPRPGTTIVLCRGQRRARLVRLRAVLIAGLRVPIRRHVRHRFLITRLPQGLGCSDVRRGATAG
jgi:hypothetical protein